MNLRDRVFGVMFRYGTFGVRREVLISVFGAGIAVAFLILTLILPKLSGEAATDTTITPSYGPSAGGTEIEITGDFTPPAPTTMQGMTAEYCATMTIYDGTNPGAILGPLTDIRVDGSGKTQDYRVARLADGNCWMLDNLKLQLYNQMTLTRADTNVANKTTVSINWLADGFPIGQTSGNFVTGGHLTKTGAAFSASTDMDAWRQVDPSGRTECTQISTYNPATLTKCGYLYNWYTATAGSSLSNFSSLSDSDTAYSICPANWRLPRGNNTDAWQNDFAVLNGFMAGDGAPYDDNSTNYTYYNNWLPAGKFQGTYSGSWFSGYNGLGITGDLWSSTRNGDLAYAADFGNNALSIYPANSSASYQRQRGFAVRCMSLPYQGPETPTIDFDGDTVTADNRYDNPDGTTTLTVTTPAHAAGVTDLTIHINGADFTLPAAYTFYDPMDITDINPDKGPTAGGTVVEITGHNLTAPINDSMQAFTADHCASLPIYNKDDPDPASTVELTDSRNGAKYLVRRLQDGKCWMTDNLRIADFSATAANTDLNTITDFYIPPLDTSGNNNNYDPYVYGPVTGDIEVGGAENYGYLYNYVAATAGEVSTSIINNTAPNSICPVGWRMPTSAYDYDDPNSDFAQLNIAMFGDSTLTDSGNYQDTAHYANWIYDGSNPSAGSFRGVLSGRFNGSFNNQGAVGFYWSSSATDPDNAYTLIINSNSSGSVSPNVDGSPDRSAGVAVRCLTEAGTPIQPSVPTVKFGSESATNVSVVDNPDGTQTITATTPQNTAGKTTVTVDNGLTTATTFFAYYDPLTIDEVNPDKGPVAGGTVVEIKGDFPESIPKLTLQEMTQAYCESMPIYDKTNPNPASTVTLKDARNGQRYDIRRLQDGNCWMIDNLKLELTSGMELTPADTNVVNPTTVWFTDDSTASGAQLDNMTGNFTTSGGLTIDGSNALTGNNTDAWRQADPSNIDKCKNNVGTISGVPYAYDPTSETGCGYLYNHYTATAGTVDSNVVSSQVVDSICPAGWRLPSAGTGSSGTVYGSADLTVLNASMNANVRTTGVTTNSFQANWWPTGSFRGSLAGYYLNGFSQLGEMGSLWTATRASSGGRARYANFNANVINLAVESGDGRQMGSSVRCVTNNGSVAYNPITNNPLYDPEVTFDGVPATNVSVSDDRKTITATTPAHATAAYVDVVVDNGFTAATLRNGFVYYNPMKITSINPDHGLTGGNTTVTITGSGFLTPTTMSTPTTMQEMNQTYCASMPTYPATGGELTLPDTRDGQTYTIRKLADGKCWMTDNLRIADYAASSADTDLASGMTFNIPATTTTGTSDYDAVQVFGPVPDDTGAGATNYGYLYSWPAAVAGETRTSMPASSGNAPNSICPAGWRLPHGATGVWNDSDNDFSQLNIAMYGDPSLTTAGNYSNASHAANWQYGTAFNGVYAGIIDSWAGFGGQGGISEYWSATTDSNPDRAIGAEVYGASSISPVTEQLRYIGQAVRCVSDGGAGLELSVEFDGIDVLEIVSATDAEIVVRTPAHAAGLVDVKVDNDLTSDTVDDGYLYYNDLKITSIDPNHGLTDGGTTVTIYGTNFEPLTLPTIPVPTTMQQMSQAFCETLPIYDKTNPDPASTVELTDARDGTKYDVRRMQDGKCWMIDNLKLELEDGVELTPADTNVVNNTTVSLAAGGRSGNFTISGRLTLDNGYDTTSPNLDAWRQVDPSSTAYCLGDTADIIKDPSGSPSSLMKLNDVGSKTGCGYLYNFYTATAGSAAQADYDNGKGAGYIAQESICPSGWRLPSGHENAADLDNDFPFLNAKMYDPTATTGSTFGSTAYGANWWSNGSFRGVASGQYYNASPTLQSEQGLFWSSNVYTGDAGSARVFKFASNGVGFGYVTRNYGLAVRCVDDENYIPELITVTFDGIPATVVSHTDTKIVVKTPSHIAGLVNVTVSNGLSTDTLPPVYIDAGGDLTDFTNVSTGYLYQEPYVALTVDTNNLTIGGSPITPSISGTYAHSPNTTSVKTNYLLGYNLTLSTNLPNSNTHASDLKETTAIPDRYLIGTTNTCTWNTTTKTLDNTTSTILNNTWGFTINSSDLTAQKLCRVPNQNNPLTIKSTNAPMETNPGDQTTFYYGTKLDYNQAAGIYRTTVVYTAVGNI